MAVGGKRGQEERMDFGTDEVEGYCEVGYNGGGCGAEFSAWGGKGSFRLVI